MTAFARQDVALPQGMLSCELRAVNHRHLELQLRLPDRLRGLEPALRDLLRQHLHRGKVELYLHLEQDLAAGLDFDRELAAKLIHLASEIDNMARHTAPVQALDILRHPGVLRQAQTAQPEDAALALAEKTVKLFLEAREREGLALVTLLKERLQALRTEISALTELLPQWLAQQNERLRRLLLGAVPEADGERLQQELVLLAQRCDVSEELDRLRTHIQEFDHQLARGGQVGRRLDFLLQEMNREANTLASKSSSSAQTLHAVEMKVIIEQLREQVQNLE